MKDLYFVSNFYKFQKLSEQRLHALPGEIEIFAAAHSLCGLLLLGMEGINGTVAGKHKAVARFKTFLSETFPGLLFKDGFAERSPFRRFKLRTVTEIVALGRPDIFPQDSKQSYLDPAEWESALAARPQAVLLDVRNRYETRIGKFKNATELGIDKFNQLEEALERACLPKDAPIFTYCTGGIRCEKAVLALRAKGYSDVWQLRGGILRYLEEFPQQRFEGECFVFDHRVSVDQQLRPTSEYALCPHCGDPGKERILCANCERNAVICASCLQIPSRATCSKNCAYHYARNLARRPNSQSHSSACSS